MKKRIGHRDRTAGLSGDDESHTSNLASVILCSISNLWSNAWGLMIATVRVELTRGEPGIGVDELRRGLRESVTIEPVRRFGSDIEKEGRLRERDRKLYHRSRSN
jgi:hypothetical protein